MLFKDKTVWIIGASSGIGRALAIDFSKLGAKIVLSSRNIEALERVKLECIANTKDCSVVPIDLEKNTDYKHKVDEVLNKYGTIDFLIVNGGVSQRSLAFETSSSVDRTIMEVNFFGNIAITKAVLPQMIKQQSGHIIPVSSIVGKFGFPLRSVYSASKHALHGFYETLRFEQFKDNIKVTIAIPGRVKTKVSINALNKDGKAYGLMDTGQEEGISPGSCSKQIIKAIRQNKKEVYIGGKELMMVRFKKWIPCLFNKIASGIDSK